MAYSILLTSLYTANGEEPVRYFYVRDGYRYEYCDAMLTVEASAKYLLARVPIDEIITIGSRTTFDEGDDGRQIELREGKNFYAADISELSAYSLFRYRIAQFIDELKIEQQDLMDLLTEKEQERVIRFLERFYEENPTEEETRKHNRFFDELAQDPEKYDRMIRELQQEIPAAVSESARYLPWLRNYLYREFKDAAKMEILPGNEDVKVRFLPTSAANGEGILVKSMHEAALEIVRTGEEEINLYVALHSDDVTDNFVVMNLLDILRVMPRSGVNLCKIITLTEDPRCLANEIRDDTGRYGITELVSAMRSFLEYGRSDMILEFWENSGVRNEKIERMIYAMRRIDVGISLCDIREIETGIRQMKELFASGLGLSEATDMNERLFALLAEGIQRDYGSLLEGGELELIDLVRWTYRKKFYQQTLTFIESKTPGDLVSKRIFYYCDDESRTDNVVRIFAELRSELRSFEYYKMDDLDHYFIKIYDRARARGGKGDAQRIYTGVRMQDLDNKDPNHLTAYTVCSKREDLEELLFSYYHASDIRNSTNHANTMHGEESRLIISESDVSARLMLIRESIEYYISCYEKVLADIEGKQPNVVRVDSQKVRELSRKIEDERYQARQEEKGNPKNPQSQQDPQARQEQQNQQARQNHHKRHR